MCHHSKGRPSGPGTISRSRGRCSGKGLRDGRLRVKADTRGGPGRGLLGRQLVFGCRSFQLLELQLELVEQVASDATQAGAAFGALAEAVAP